MTSPEDGSRYFRNLAILFNITTLEKKVLVNVGDVTCVKALSKIYVTNKKYRLASNFLPCELSEKTWQMESL